MRALAFSILMAACATQALAANAQSPPAAPSVDNSAPVITSQPNEPQWAGDPVMPCCDLNDTRRARSFGHGVAALEAHDFALAESIFGRILLFNGNDTTVRFHMGIAKMNLGKWSEAKTYLKTAVRRWRELPDPKGHLGVTYAKLGDIDGANRQRARLVEMAEDCRGKCKLSPYINDGIQMIDEALARPAS